MLLKKNSGFTLTEVLIVVAIIGIITGVAYPSYLDSVRKARRTDATAALQDAAGLQEKQYFQFNQYSSNVSDVGGSASEEGFYTISVDHPCGDTSCFRMIATAMGAQASDQDCLVFTLDNTRAKLSFSDSAGGTQTAECW